MNPKLLIDALVKQTTVLIAQLSTTAGIRAPLSHVADQIFLELSREIEAQGVSRKVAADMFGMALRSYQSKVARLAASATDRDRTLWEAVLDFVAAEGPVDRRRLLQRFRLDDPLSVGAVLSDLATHGYLERTGPAGGGHYRVATDEERRRTLAALDARSVEALVWVAIYRGARERDALVSQLGIDGALVDAALAALIAEGRVQRAADGALGTSGVTIPLGAEHGWEAAVFDHFQAMVAAVVQKLRGGAPRAQPTDAVGGSTVSFELYDGHPLRDEVLGLLRRVRGEVNDLWARVGAHNQAQGAARPTTEVVSFYFGQSVSREEPG